MIFSLESIGEKKHKSLGKKPNHKSIKKTKFSSSRKWRTTAHVREKYTQQIQNREFHTQQISNRLREPQCGWMVMMKIPKRPNREGETYHRKIHGGENSSQASLCEKKKMKDVGVCPNGPTFWVFTCPKSQNWFSPKMGFPQIWISFPYSSHPYSITTSTNF